MLTLSSIEKVRDAVKIEDVIAARGIKLKREGAGLVCLCPFHKEKSPSLHISTEKNLWNCFGCGAGGDAITFVRNYEGCDFEQAITLLAEQFHVTIEHSTEPLSEEDRRQALKTELMRNSMDTVQQYYAANLWRTDIPECVEALKYARERWHDDEFIRTQGIGYSINDWQHLISYAHTRNIGASLLSDMGVAKQSEKGHYYDFFRGRIMIPIKNRSSRTIAFTARIVPEQAKNDTPKYLHNANTLIFKKDETVFGINIAARAAARMGKCYLVEGAPDALRLHSLNIENAVACLGAEWTDGQFAVIKSITSKICFIPDADLPPQTIVEPLDKYGTGIRKVIAAGKRALSKGFHVLVKEIPLGEATDKTTKKKVPCKQDPDDYFTTHDKFSSTMEEDFIIWYADKILDKTQATSVNNAAVAEIADLICYTDIDSEIALYIERLHSILPGKDAWKKAIDAARTKRAQQAMSKDSKQFSDLKKYGFVERDHGYWTTAKGGKMIQWSNFVLQPLFHVRGINTAIRLYRITNEDNVSMIIEFKQEDLNTLARFKNKVECLGNFVWLAKDDQLTQLKTYLYRETESADLITQLGWQKKGFYAFANGVHYNNQWYPVDRQGIIRLPDKGTFYIPAFSEVYENDEDDTYAFERTFVHLDYSTISLYDIVHKMLTVFGENAMVAFAFLLAALFRDVVTAETKTFPMLNLFGPYGSGKSELCHSLMAFFIVDNAPVNLRTSSLPFIAMAVGACSNALIHLDEFKNDIDPEKVEFLKGIWDGVGRNKINIDRSNGRESSRVNSGVLVAGQEISSKDPALLSRFLLLPFGRNAFDADEKRLYDDLQRTRKRGCTHLTLQLLKFRAEFEQTFRYHYREISKQVSEQLSDTVETRIMVNWVIPLASFRSMEKYISVPFTYEQLYSVSVKLLVDQSEKSRNTNEMAQFWRGFTQLVTKGRIYENGDYRIKKKSWVRVKTGPKSSVKRILNKDTIMVVFKFDRVYDEYARYCAIHRFDIPNKESLKQYIISAQNFLGIIPCQRFAVMINGVLQYDVEPTETTKGVIAEHVTEAFCIDYELTAENFEFNLPSKKIVLPPKDDDDED